MQKGGANLISKGFIDSLSNLIDEYGKYLEKHSGENDQLDIHMNLHNILRKLSNHLEKHSQFTDESNQ